MGCEALGLADVKREAWFCPACQKHHAPHVETCPAPVDLIGKLPMPTYPNQLGSVCPKCGLKMDGVMGYVCPNYPCPTGLGGASCLDPGFAVGPFLQKVAS